MALCKHDGGNCVHGGCFTPALPSDPDPNAVKVAEGTYLHHGLYLRGSGPEATPDYPDWREMARDYDEREATPPSDGCGSWDIHDRATAALTPPSEEATGLNAETLGRAMERRGIRVSRADALYIAREYARLTASDGGRE